MNKKLLSLFCNLFYCNWKTQAVLLMISNSFDRNIYFFTFLWAIVQANSSRSFSNMKYLMLFFLQTKLFPTIYLYWQKYQAQMLAKVKAIQGGITIAGDGRHDSMGHSAKFGAYTIFCCTVPMIIHFSLVQVSHQS